MSGDTDRDTFQSINWDDVDDEPYEWSFRSAGQAVVLATLGLAFLFDYLVLPTTNSPIPLVVEQTQLVPPNSWEFGFWTLALGWDLTGVDWLFLLTLAMLFFNGVVPLYENPRLTNYYWTQFKRNRLAVAASAYLVAAFLVGILGPLFLEPPTTLQFDQRYLPPVGFTASPLGETVHGTWEHPLGTDQRGRDMITLLVYGMKISMQVGLISTFIAITIATTVGSAAAYLGGLVDEALMRYVDFQQTLPTFLMLVLLVYMFGGSLFWIIALYGFFTWGGTARLVRSEALQRREEEYVRAAENTGASKLWILRRHIVPNVSRTVITSASLAIPIFILGEAALSFLGLGDPNVPSWGRTIAGGRGDLATAPWIATIPGFVLFLTVLAFNFVGDALGDALDPRSEGSGGE